MRWPIAIALGLLFVVAVDFSVLWIAVHHPVEIDPSYESASR
jgi:hypothetical protein